VPGVTPTTPDPPSVEIGNHPLFANLSPLPLVSKTDIASEGLANLD
jgi:hypothetical protein